MNNWLKQNRFKIFLILIAVLIILFQYLQNLGLKYDIAYFKAVPSIDLYNSAEFRKDSSSYDKIYISGFVAFEDINEQPRDLRQYYIIESLLQRDNNLKQVFRLREVISFYNIPPKEFDPVLLTEENNSSTKLTLKDEIGSLFIIDKLTGEVIMRDITGDKTYLITDDSEYRDFMLNFWK